MKKKGSNVEIHALCTICCARLYRYAECGGPTQCPDDENVYFFCRKGKATGACLEAELAPFSATLCTDQASLRLLLILPAMLWPCAALLPFYTASRMLFCPHIGCRCQARSTARWQRRRKPDALLTLATLPLPACAAPAVRDRQRHAPQRRVPQLDADTCHQPGVPLLQPHAARHCPHPVGAPRLPHRHALPRGRHLLLLLPPGQRCERLPSTDHRPFPCGRLLVPVPHRTSPGTCRLSHHRTCSLPTLVSHHTARTGTSPFVPSS